MPSMSVYIPDTVRDSLLEHATEVDRSASWVITRAVSEYLTQINREAGRTHVIDTDDWEYGPVFEERLAQMAEETGMNVDHCIHAMLKTALGLE